MSPLIPPAPFPLGGGKGENDFEALRVKSSLSPRGEGLGVRGG